MMNYAEKNQKMLAIQAQMNENNTPEEHTMLNNQLLDLMADAIDARTASASERAKDATMRLKSAQIKMRAQNNKRV